MAFLNPLFLLGLLAAGIPLIIHLFNFRRPRRVDFSSLTFVRELQKTTMQRVKLKQLLLLLLRTLAIAMLVLAFARPTLTGGLAGALGGRSSSAVALIVDNSASMSVRDSGGEYLEQARILARAVAAQMDASDELHVFAAAGPLGTTVPLQSSTGAREEIDRIDAGAYARSTREMLNRAAERLAESSQTNKVIYLISDLQRSTLGDSIALQIPEDVTTVLMPVGERSHPNVGVTVVRVVSRIIEVGEPVRIEVAVQNYGDAPLRDYTVSAFLGEERVAQAPVDLEPGASVSVPLVVTPQEQQWLGGRIEGEDDAFPRDNVRYFTLYVPQTRRVLLVRGEASRTNYVRLALAAREGRSGAIFEVQEIHESELSTDPGRLSEFDALILAGLSRFSPNQAEMIAQYVENGGGMLVYPSASGEIEGYNRLFETLEAGRLAGYLGELNAPQFVASFENVDEEHVLFQGVFERSDGGEARREVESPGVSYVAAYVPGSPRENTLIGLTSGHPFLQEIRAGRGTVLFLASAPELSWSDLPVRGLFVPLVYRSLQYLSASESVQGEDLMVGGAETIRLTGVIGSEQVRIISPSGEETIPSQRSLPGAVLVETEGWIVEPGVYDVRQGDLLQRRVAGNVDRAESDLATMDAADLAEQLRSELAGQVRVLEVPTAEAHGAYAAIERQSRGVEIWNVFLMLALAFMIAEMIVARQWRPEAVAS